MTHIFIDAIMRNYVLHVISNLIIILFVRSHKGIKYYKLYRVQKTWMREKSLPSWLHFVCCFNVLVYPGPCTVLVYLFAICFDLPSMSFFGYRFVWYFVFPCPQERFIILCGQYESWYQRYHANSTREPQWANLVDQLQCNLTGPCSV